MDPQIDLHIDELVLDGFSGLDGSAVEQALAAALTRLLAQRGVPPSLAGGASIPQVDAGAVELPPGLDAAGVGQRLGNTLYRGLGG